MPELIYRYVTLPDEWPGKKRPGYWKPKPSPFKIRWTEVEKDLARELKYLGAKDVTLALDIRNPGHFRQDGMLRAEARPVTPAVILSFVDKNGVRLQFPCDTFAFWQDNVSAIARALEALRMVDRYGVTQGDKQYVGFKALPPGSSSNGNGGAPKMTRMEAASIIASLSPFPAHLISAEPSVRGEAIKMAKRKAHPDAGGDASAFQKVTEAVAVLEGA